MILTPVALIIVWSVLELFLRPPENIGILWVLKWKKGGHEILLSRNDISQSEAELLVEKWKELSEGKVLTKSTWFGMRELTKKELEIKVISETRPMGHLILNAAKGNGVRIVNEIDKRAKDFAKTVNKLTDKGDIVEVCNKLCEYKKEVGDCYEKAYKLASDIDYRFDIDKVANVPALNKAHMDDPFMGDPQQIENFKAIMTRIDNLKDTQTFSHLLGLCETINDLKSTDVMPGAQESLAKSIKSIDKEIKSATDKYLTKEQAKLFKRAKKEYYKLKKLEDNVLYKAILKEGSSEEGLSE